MTFLQNYNRLYKKILNFMTKVNPCKVEDGHCLRARLGGNNFCCGECCQYKPCKHLTKDGCSAEKPIACKLWLCREAIDNLTMAQRKKYYELDDEYWKFKSDYDIKTDFRLSQKEIVRKNDIHIC